ncbi:hypothetical protein CYMTET_43388 [Cymbomonas tetramitiformis]|uniref:ATP-sulfurylase PUA-like domain-containing protein n=1 Tax=Cymbomonas tetramitiformis TaxID=36881 RepID=A0AAE0C2B1_9CHLO|nr:hypothetical protein CYMTET_43388 [Cymbomonas tetramitiformis]
MKLNQYQLGRSFPAAFAPGSQLQQLRVFCTQFSSADESWNAAPTADKGDLLKECNGRVLALSDRGACDVELLMNGGFSPLEGFMNQETYKHVVLNARLPNGTLFGLPVVLDTMDEFLKPGQKVALEYKARVLAVLEIDSKWIPDKPLEAYHCYGSTLLEHPGVQMICMERGKYYLGGNVYGLELPARDIPCATPSEVRAQLPKNAVSSIARCPPQDD